MGAKKQTAKRPRSAKAKLPRAYRLALGAGAPEITELRIPVKSREPSNVAEIEARLRAAGIAMSAGEVPRPENRRVPGAVVELELAIGAVERDRAPLRVRIAARPATTTEVPESELDWSRLTKPEVDAARASTWSVILWSELRRGSALSDFHELLRVAAAVAPDACALMDVCAFRTHAPRWLFDAAASRVPPSPTSLYTIHSVYDDKDSDAGVWMHTHGLLRCGTVELEMAEIPLDGLSSMGTLMNAVAPMFIERRVPGPRERFLAGRGIDLVWLPWEDVMPLLQEGVLGAQSDRDRDHSRPSAVLFAPGKEGVRRASVRNPAAHLGTLDANPVLFVSDMETARNALLSKERLPSFLALFDEHAGDPGWMFLVKLGYEIDDADGPTDREHLWFDVHATQAGTEIEGTLLNEPYHIARLHEGQRGRHSLERLSGWSIISPRGRFGPESVLDLQRNFEKPDPEQLQ